MTSYLIGSNSDDEDEVQEISDQLIIKSNGKPSYKRKKYLNSTFIQLNPPNMHEDDYSKHLKKKKIKFSHSSELNNSLISTFSNVRDEKSLEKNKSIYNIIENNDNSPEYDNNNKSFPQEEIKDTFTIIPEFEVGEKDIFEKQCNQDVEILKNYV